MKKLGSNEKVVDYLMNKYNIDNTSKLFKSQYVEIVKEAIKNTFSKRDSLDVLNDYTQILNDILNYERIKIYWKKYTEKNKYAQGIIFEKILEVIREFLNEIEIVTISV